MVDKGVWPSNLYDSRTWTGLNLPSAGFRLRQSRHPRIRYFLWWAAIGLKRLLCRHDWSLHRCACEICGLTVEELQDHNPGQWLAPKNVGFFVRERT